MWKCAGKVEKMSLLNRLKAVQPLMIVLILTIFLRAWAVSLLPQDFDEPVYLQNAFDYASAFRSGNFNAVIDFAGNPEHPAFVKLLYTGTVLVLGKAATWTEAFFASRAVSAFFGMLAVLFIALAVDPLAAGMLAVNTLAVKYTSQVYLEAVPHAMTIAAVLAFLRTSTEKPDRWFWLSAAALGVAAASKYTYLPVILVVLCYLAIFEKRIKFHWLVLYGVLSLVVFFILDVRLWHDPFTRLYQSLTFHVQYSQGQHVEDVGYPWYQPFVWIFTSPAANWHPNVFFYFGFDGLISILAILGIKREWKERRWLVIWLVTGMLFLLLWPTKWPQYALSVTPALCIMGAGTLIRLIRLARNQNEYWDYLKEMLPKPTNWFWLAISAFVIFLAAIYLSAAIKLAVGRVGWSNITRSNSFLPSNTVYALLPLEAGKLMIGTEQGVGIWTPAQATEGSPSWTIFTMANSGLSSNRVLSMVRDMQGDYWFGTGEGVNRFDGSSWTRFQVGELGLPDDYILSLAASPDGRVYAGTLSGAAVWNGVSWSPLGHTQGQAVFTLTSDSRGQYTWFGLGSGASRLDIRDGTWTDYPADSPVKHILIDSKGTLWAATSGAGLARLDGSTWTYFRTSNSGIPFNTVNWVVEDPYGVLWVGTAMPTSAGGAAASFDGFEWHTFFANNSGSSEAEVTVLAVQSGQVWMGTRTQGIDLYKPGREK
jgi:sugar lactone lactonase YvrE/4-amino-4-deoxy-L-arabinose transferase-like glycosyltransferase